jgi:hypothetical protein
MRRFLLLGLAACACGLRADNAPQVTATAPARARNWVLPLFTPEGYLSMRLTGSEAHPFDNDRVDLTEVNVTVFTGKAAPQVKTILLSPAASYFYREKRVSGPGAVRMIRYLGDREIYEITGEDWAYEEAGEKVSIRKNVHLVYAAPLNGLAP